MMDSQCKKCRRAGEKLFLKGERCYSQKCAIVRRPYAPGLHGKSMRRRISEYGQQLAEKQRVRHNYGVSEKQFKNYFKEILGQKGNKEELLISKLEGRLDNTVFRLGFAGSSRRLARQIVNHGHILLNGRKVDIPSYQVKKDDIVKIKERSKKIPLFSNLATTLKKHKMPNWLSLDIKNLEGKVVKNPQVEDILKVGRISMIIEFYSR